ncbi:hypothetical protein ACJ72_05737 [Emergomyces africanus]|uniref:Uncharacterized protein n=1 Tax=Emergomyces africanus TaxID=1955775 RepID=A0A1B7NTH4_9EURO|nr:hypothetical protein ACJ72_05737 [Emergomyces africanus]
MADPNPHDSKTVVSDSRNTEVELVKIPPWAVAAANCKITKKFQISIPLCHGLQLYHGFDHHGSHSLHHCHRVENKPHGISHVNIKFYHLAITFSPLITGPLSKIYGGQAIVNASNVWFLVWNKYEGGPDWV